MKKITLLSQEEACGVNGGRQLDVLQKYGKNSAVTDLAIITGCDYSKKEEYTAPDDHSLKGRTGSCYTKSSNGKGDIQCIEFYDKIRHEEHYSRSCAIRPVLKSSKIFYKIYPNRVKGYNGTEEVEYGEYPQYAPNKNIQNELEREYEQGLLRTTGRNYTFGKTKIPTYFECFEPETYKEYYYKGKKYIRINEIFRFDGGFEFKLSNGEFYCERDSVWIEVSPIVWLIDAKTKTLISKRGILSGIRFNSYGSKYNGDFSKTEMKMYLDNFMTKDILQNAVNQNTVEDANKEEQTDEFYQNAYDELTKIEEDSNVNIEDLNMRYNTKSANKEDANELKRLLIKVQRKKDKSNENVDSSYEEGKKYLEEVRKQEKKELEKLMAKYDSDNSISTIKKGSEKNLSEEIIEFNNIDEEPYSIEDEKEREDIKKLFKKFKKLEDRLGVEKENMYDFGENVVKLDKEYNKKIIEKFDKIQEKVYEIQQNTVNIDDNINSSEKYSKEDIKELLKYIKKLNEKIDEFQSEEVAKKM